VKNKFFKLILFLSIFVVAGFFVGAGEAKAINSPDHLWHFNECSGLSAADFVGGDNFNIGGNAWDIGKWNCGLKQYYKYGAAQANFSQPVNANNLTLSFYYKFLDSGSRLYFRLTNSLGQQIKIIPAPSYTEIYGLPTSFGARLNKGWPADNQWHQIVLSIDAAAGQWKLYLDGSEFYNYSGSAFSLPEFSTLEIKGDNNYNWIDEAALWPSVLTPAEMQTIYQANRELEPQAPIIPADEKKMLNLWQFDEGQGSVIADTIGQTTLPQNAGWTQGKWASGLYQSWQTGQRINANLSQTINARDLTLEFWWKNSSFPNEARGRFYLEGPNGQFGIIPSIVRTTLITPYGSTVIEPSPLANFNDANWHHLALVLNSSGYSLDFYIDAQKVYTKGLIPLNLSLSSIHFYGENYPYSLDEFTVWQGALSQQDITDYYNSGQPHKKPGLDPVILVPGIMGSYLFDQIGEEVWPNIPRMAIDPWDLHLNGLALPENGEPTGNSVMVPNDIFRNILDKDFFQGLITELKNNGYEEGENLFVFPYDWRWNINWAGGVDPYPNIQSLAEKVEEIKNQTGAEKVNIIAHSMGGLVAKYYIKHYGSNSVNKFVDIATPHLGAPEALKILMYGDDLGTYAINQDRIKTISQNFPSVYQLLPSRNYFNNADPNYTYYIYDMHDLDNNGITGRLSYDQAVEFMKNTGRNEYLLDFNDILHNDLDNYSPQSDNIKTYNIIGCGQPTIGQIFVLNKEKSGKYEYGLKYINGDGTVPLRSAETLLAGRTYYASKIEHPYLPSANGVRQLITSILGNEQDNFNPSQYDNLSQEKNICSFSGTQISYHSPIELHIYDEAGNHVGPNENGDIEINIPGVQYDIIDGNKFAFLPEGLNYQIIAQATNTGSFNARIQNIENGEYTRTAYYNEVPLNSTSANTRVEINDSQEDYTMQIDQDGDNIYEASTTPSSILSRGESGDLAKPETDLNIIGVQGHDDWYISDIQVELTAQDNEGGSGILKTEYSLDNGNTWAEYQGPFIIGQEGTTTISYQSTDRAGNVEEIKEQTIKIDKTGPTMESIIPQEGDKIRRGKLLDIEYEINDDYSGVASSTIMLNNEILATTTIDLFYYNLGSSTLRIIAADIAGNTSENIIQFAITADIDSSISDISRAYLEGMIIKEKVKNDLIKELEKIEKYIEKYGQRQEKRDEKFEKRLKNCGKVKNQEKCEKTITKLYNKITYRLNKVHHKIVVKDYQNIIKHLQDYYKKRWINEEGYGIIKEDINFLINNL